MASKLKLSGDFDFASLAKRTPGYVGADLTALTGVAGVIAVKRIFQQMNTATATVPAIEPPQEDKAEETVSQIDGMVLDDAAEGIATPPNETAVPDLEDRPILFASLPLELHSIAIASFLRNHRNALSDEELAPLAINDDDFNLALLQVQPSSKREGFATVPDVTWQDVGALMGIRDELRMAIVQPIRRPEVFEALGISSPCGVLLWGPPGCGKTLLAKAVANESMANFISVKGPELLNKVRDTADISESTHDPVHSTLERANELCGKSSLVQGHRRLA